MNVLGIDPGSKGALALWQGNLLVTYEIPTAKSTGRGREILWSELNEQWDDLFWFAEHVFLERVNARPKDGGSSAFKFGSTYGGLRGMIAAKMIPCTLVTPGVWMKAMGVGQDPAGTTQQAPAIPDHATVPAYCVFVEDDYHEGLLGYAVPLDFRITSEVRI